MGRRVSGLCSGVARGVHYDVRVALSREAAIAMRAKYAEMREMRVEHAEGREDAARVPGRMSDLAARFPGALRDGRRRVDTAVLAAFLREAPTLPFAREITAWRDDLASVASPPAGRVMDLVFARVAGVLGVTKAVARALIFTQGVTQPVPGRTGAGPSGAAAAAAARGRRRR